MKKLTSEMATRCELAMMGKVVTCSNEEVQLMTEYIYKVMGKDPTKLVNILEDTIRKYSKDNNVKYIVVNRLYGMPTITYLLQSDEDRYPAPFKEDYGTFYPCAFCFAFNLDSDWCSEFGDCFFEKKSDGYYHRVS